MSDKISPLAVIKEALKISWAGKWKFLGVNALSLLPIGVMAAVAGLGAYNFPVEFVVFLFLFPALLAMMVFIFTATFHLAITIQRGEGRLLPEKLLPAMGKVTVRGLILLGVWMGLCLLLIGPLALVLVVFGADGQIEAWAIMAANLVCFMGVFVLYGIILRFGLMMPGAAVGTTVTLVGAWKMSKGHALRMFGSYLLVMIVDLVLQIGPALLLGVSESGIAQNLTAISLLVVPPAVFSVAMMIVFMVMQAVWYEKLRLRQETISATSPSAGEPPAAASAE